MIRESKKGFQSRKKLKILYLVRNVLEIKKNWGNALNVYFPAK